MHALTYNTVIYITFTKRDLKVNAVAGKHGGHGEKETGWIGCRTAQNNFIQLISYLGPSLGNGSTNETNIKRCTNNEKRNGEGDTGSKEPGSLLACFTLEETKEVKVLGFGYPSFQTFQLCH